MNREIKFRIWDGNDLYPSMHGPFAWNRLPNFDNPDNFVLQQFTGLKDKNGREIYEGDLITYTEKMHEHGDAQQFRGKVIYDPERAAFGISNTGDLDGIWNYFTDMVIGNFEVVGNVFEGAKK